MIENNSKCLAICRLCRLTMSKDGHIILLSNSVLYNYGTFGIFRVSFCYDAKKGIKMLFLQQIIQNVCD